LASCAGSAVDAGVVVAGMSVSVWVAVGVGVS
jgi:hypothetical protein